MRNIIKKKEVLPMEFELNELENVTALDAVDDFITGLSLGLALAAAFGIC